MTQKRYVRIRASCDVCGVEQVAEDVTVEDAQQKLIDSGWHIYGFRPEHDYCGECARDVDRAIKELIRHA